VIATDTNILLYAHRAESPWHDDALALLDQAAQGAWAIPWPCLHEFLAIATHPRVFDPPTPAADARRAVEAWLETPTVHLLAEREGYWELLAELLERSRVVGPRIHDARIAALCLQHAVTELWTADRDFSRFPGVPAINPLATRRR
jgi:toxin-antitoxin system PIN domain toxin